MTRLPAAAILALGYVAPAAATWLQCNATGSNGSGPVAYATTSADVGSLTPDRMAYFKKLLGAYIAKADPSTAGIAVACAPYDDVTSAASHYSQTLSATARRVGWDHVTVLQPADWLPAKDIVTDPSRP